MASEKAALFYALSLMGTVRPGDPAGLETRLRAGAIAKAVYEKHPDHPGAAHYVIHAYDDPGNAEKALDAARAYAETAPESPHALHMPSHIFLQLEMWPEAATSNEASWAASNRWGEEREFPIGKRDYHSLLPSHELLGEILLRAGREQEAAKEFEVSLERHKDPARSLLGLARSGNSRAYQLRMIVVAVDERPVHVENDSLHTSPVEQPACQIRRVTYCGSEGIALPPLPGEVVPSR